MTELVLFHMPGACSRVTLNALEEIGLSYEDRGVDLAAAEQRSPEYLAINPKGKVPALKIAGRLYTENAAILFFLHTLHPSAGLIPTQAVGLELQQQGLEDLVWFSSTVHPMVRQVRMPARFTDGDCAGVREHGVKHLTEFFSRSAERVSNDRWWYGEHWSIVDVYLSWCCSAAADGGMDVTPWPALANHAKRVSARPSFIRALARETAALARMGKKL